VEVIVEARRHTPLVLAAAFVKNSTARAGSRETAEALVPLLELQQILLDESCFSVKCLGVRPAAALLLALP
jgi:hypothetical protein